MYKILEVLMYKILMYKIVARLVTVLAFGISIQAIASGLDVYSHKTGTLNSVVVTSNGEVVSGGEIKVIDEKGSVVFRTSIDVNGRAVISMSNDWGVFTIIASSEEKSGSTRLDTAEHIEK